MIYFQDESITIDGRPIALGMRPEQDLARAAIVSLFTWRRAHAGDPLPGSEKMGWWGDSFPRVANDRIGSRLWLLAREKITPRTLTRAREYALEALQWMLDDGVASRVDVAVERQGLDRVALQATIHRAAGALPVNLRFPEVWGFLS